MKATGLLCALSVLTACLLQADTNYFAKATGNWSVDANWDSYPGDGSTLNIAPLNDSRAKINTRANVTITLTGAAKVGYLALNDNTSPLSVVVDGGSLHSDMDGNGQWNAIGYNLTASMLVTNGGSWQCDGRICVGLFDGIDGQINILTMAANSGGVTAQNNFQIGQNFDDLDAGANSIHATAMTFVHGGTLTIGGDLTIDEQGRCLMDIAGTGKVINKNKDIRNNVAAFVASGRMTAGGGDDPDQLIRAVYSSPDTRIAVTNNTDDFVIFMNGSSGIAGSGDGDWANGANWINQSIGYGDGYAPGTNDTVRIDSARTATITNDTMIGGLLMGDNYTAPTLIIDGAELRAVNATKKGWSSISYNRTSTLILTNGAAFHFDHPGAVLVGHGDNIDNTLVSVLIEKSCTLSSRGTFQIGGGYDASHIASVHVIVKENATLDVGGLTIDNDNNLAGKGTLYIDIAQPGGKIIVNGNILETVQTWYADGRLRACNGSSLYTIKAEYDAGADETTVTAIAQPGTIIRVH